MLPVLNDIMAIILHYSPFGSIASLNLHRSVHRGQFYEQKVGSKISIGGISPGFVKNQARAFLLEDRFLLDFGKIYSSFELMKLAPELSICGVAGPDISMLK